MPEHVAWNSLGSIIELRLEGGKKCWNADADNSWWGIVHGRVFLPRAASAHVFVCQRVCGACSKDFLQDEDTPAPVEQVFTVPNSTWSFPLGRGRAYCAKSCWTCKTPHSRQETPSSSVLFVILLSLYESHEVQITAAAQKVLNLSHFFPHL